MKTLKFFLIPVMMLLLLNACIIDNHHYEDVNACFTVSGSTHYVNESVYFVNCSQYAYSYEWDFGDGYSSNQRNPSHAYLEPGNYQVTMTAFGDYDQETFTDVVTVTGSTDLNILVMYLGTEDPVSNCDVTLFATEDDWQNLTNPLVDAATASDGIVVFTGLDPVVYYIDAYKYVSETQFYSNYYQGYATLALNLDEVNYYNIYVELLNTSKGFRKDNVVIKMIEKSSKEDHDRIIKASLNK
jgi:PKD repeat protein